MKKSKLTLTIALLLILSLMMGMAAFATAPTSGGSIEFKQSTDYPLYGVYDPGEVDAVPAFLVGKESMIPPAVWAGFKGMSSWDLYFGEWEVQYSLDKSYNAITRGASPQADTIGVIIHTNFDKWVLKISSGNFTYNNDGKNYLNGYGLLLTTPTSVSNGTVTPAATVGLNAGNGTQTYASGNAGWHGISFGASLNVPAASLKTAGELQTVLTWNLSEGTP
jgi:hypothetical protein